MHDVCKSSYFYMCLSACFCTPCSLYALHTHVCLYLCIHTHHTRHTTWAACTLPAMCVSTCLHPTRTAYMLYPQCICTTPNMHASACVYMHYPQYICTTLTCTRLPVYMHCIHALPTMCMPHTSWCASTCLHPTCTLDMHSRHAL